MTDPGSSSAKWKSHLFWELFDCSLFATMFTSYFCVKSLRGWLVFLTGIRCTVIVLRCLLACPRCPQYFYANYLSKSLVVFQPPALKLIHLKFYSNFYHRVCEERGGRTLIFTTHNRWELGTVESCFPPLVLARNWVIWPSLTYHIDKVPHLIFSFSYLRSHQSLKLLNARDIILINYKKVFLISILTNFVIEILPGTGWYNNLPRVRGFFLSEGWTRWKK